MLWETILLAQREVRRNALRLSLTILGVVIGVAAVITLVTLGGGATAKVTDDISNRKELWGVVRLFSGPRPPGWIPSMPCGMNDGNELSPSQACFT